jgi:hypothetical protein
MFSNDEARCLQGIRFFMRKVRDMVQPTLRTVLLTCLLAVLLSGCGSSATDQARTAAEGYVHALGHSDGRATCSHMTVGLQRRFGSAVTFANPELSGDCPKLMQASLDAIGPSQLQQFGTAAISGVKVKGSSGTFIYSVRGTRINGRVAQEKGKWLVSCCVPGQED